MKKLLLATPKKLLLAASIVAMSSTAMATSVLLDSAKTDTLAVTAHYVTPLTVALSLATINFGDVYTDSAVTPVAVSAAIAGTQDETFTYTIASSGALALIAGADTGSTLVPFTLGAKTLNFTVGLDTANLVTDTDVAETVTITVTYDAIAGTTTS